MNTLRASLAVLVVLALFGCAEAPKTYQGWVEANLIFVAPDETGRVETLSVREGEHIDKGAPLFTVDDDLQQPGRALETRVPDRSAAGQSGEAARRPADRRHTSGRIG